jgi:L-alanine-DL-glutamate epimerase-like enolase superfamily enzyme
MSGYFQADGHSIRPREVGRVKVPSDTICLLREDDLLVRPFMKTISNRYADVARGPGLGVDLNEDAVCRYQVK